MQISWWLDIQKENYLKTDSKLKNDFLFFLQT